MVEPILLILKMSYKNRPGFICCLSYYGRPDKPNCPACFGIPDYLNSPIALIPLTSIIGLNPRFYMLETLELKGPSIRA